MAFAATLVGVGCGGAEVGPSREATVALNQRMVWSRYGSPLSATAPVGEAQMLVDMIAHHQDAIDASWRILQHTRSAQVRDFAERLVRVQSEQVVQLEIWLAQWYPGERPATTWVALFDDTDMSDDAGLRGGDTDAAYLTTMIDHHRHAVAMYENWVASGALQHDEFGLLMRRVAKGQVGEVAALRQLLG